MGKLDDAIELIDRIPSLAKEQGESVEETAMSLIHTLMIAYANEEAEVDVFDFLVSCALTGMYVEGIQEKIYYDLHQMPLFHSVQEDLKAYEDPLTSKEETAKNLAKQYFKLFYQSGAEDVDAFLWRCIVLGLLPNSEFLRKKDEERRSLLPEDIDWMFFYDYLNMSEEEKEEALHLTNFHMEMMEDDPFPGEA